MTQVWFQNRRAKCRKHESQLHKVSSPTPGATITVGSSSSLHLPPLHPANAAYTRPSITPSTSSIIRPALLPRLDKQPPTFSKMPILPRERIPPPPLLSSSNGGSKTEMEEALESRMSSYQVLRNIAPHNSLLAAHQVGCPPHYHLLLSNPAVSSAQYAAVAVASGLGGHLLPGLGPSLLMSSLLASPPTKHPPLLPFPSPAMDHPATLDTLNTFHATRFQVGAGLYNCGFKPK